MRVHSPQRPSQPVPLHAAKTAGSDEALTRAMLAGHAAAPRLLYDRYGQLVRRLLLRMLLLGDAARLSQRPAQAEQVYVRIRARFPGSREAALSAFALGRIEHDQRRAVRQAAEWFETYLREAPRGSLGCEALGRLMEARSSLKQTREASTTAATYLVRCSGGSHAALARELTQRAPQPTQGTPH